MSIAISVRAAGKHSAANTDLRARRAEADNIRLTAALEDRERDLHTALIRGCQDAMRIAWLEEQRAGLVAHCRELTHKTIRALAEQERLRQAVVNARPRIREVPTDLVRPYSPVVVLPYVSPVDHEEVAS
ncbi:hypothetical protein ACIGXF_16815 [Streptomyces sp. NPDC053086]|uniref:hypothetical protein n=1 Tax=unclassified Streptomyces TaxID=2593676 RepID=UPI0037D98607